MLVPLSTLFVGILVHCSLRIFDLGLGRDLSHGIWSWEPGEVDDGGVVGVPGFSESSKPGILSTGNVRSDS